MEKVLVYVFKIIGILIISILLWSLFIGSPSSNSGGTDGVSTGEYATRGSYFEQIAYGNETSGFKWLNGVTWCENSGVNGYYTAVILKDSWNISNNKAPSVDATRGSLLRW